jgi:unsaturated rhamnogalacturonyl hydrolase
MRAFAQTKVRATKSLVGVAAMTVLAGWGSEPVSTVVVIGGLKGADWASAAIEKLPRIRGTFRVLGMNVANPERETLGFPPTGVAYRENGRSHFIWRWLALRAPDLVVIAGDEDFGLATALGPSVATVRVRSGDLLGAIPKTIAISAAHREMNRRLGRSPREFAEELSRVYGHEFDSPVYIPAMALIARIRMGQQAEVAALLAPYVEGRKDSLAKVTSSHLAGHLVFAEMAKRTGDARYVERVRAAADLGFTESGEMREAMPMHSEMSDAVFMGCPILASAGKLTGKSTYFDMAARHLQFMQKLCVRGDGLYRHSPLSEAAWGRGNGFPALGLAWTLEEMPEGHPAFAGMVRSFQAHMEALAKFQDGEGMWHEVIDRPDSYAEFSATAMIAAAMLRGVRHGWLARSFGDRARAAWRGILARSGEGGVLMDVCESTGKQKSVEDYLRRGASLGRDDRGGGMAMLLAVEMEK